jgi:predicted RecA/RadA family phage recombinase
VINFIQPANTIPLVAPRALKSGDGVVVGQFFAICTVDTPSGAIFEGQIEGGVSLNKGSTSPNPGDVAHFDEPTQKLVATGGVPIGIVYVGASPDNAANAWVKLVPSKV